MNKIAAVAHSKVLINRHINQNRIFILFIFYFPFLSIILSHFSLSVNTTFRRNTSKYFPRKGREIALPLPLY